MKKEKEEKGYSKEGERNKLSLMKSSYDIKYKSEASKESKDIGQRIVKEAKEKLGQEEKIKAQERKVYSQSIPGKISKGIGGILSRMNKGLTKPVTSKSIMKKSRATLTIENKEVPSVLNDPNRFFNKTYEKEKRSMFLE
jgi:hypothetical protein